LNTTILATPFTYIERDSNFSFTEPIRTVNFSAVGFFDINSTVNVSLQVYIEYLSTSDNTNILRYARSTVSFQAYPLRVVFIRLS